jgi:hypothetical protein
MPKKPESPEPGQTPSHVEVGHWWFGVPCVRCGEFLAFVYDPRHGKSGFTFRGEPGAWVVITCHACQWEGRYRPEQIENRQYLASGWGPSEDQVERGLRLRGERPPE